ncbi:MAG: acetyltransferase [Marmoricola sp.]|nr:acetyltransferase [Marmoricola sp.]
MGERRLTIFAVGSPYTWDVVETAQRLGRRFCSVDNLGVADPDLPGLTGLDEHVERGPFTLGLASAEHRRLAAHAAGEAGYDEPVALVDPTAVVALSSELGHGTYVNAGAVVGARTRVGCHVNLNRSASIGHHCELGFASATGPAAVLAGAVSVGSGAFIGAGATVLPGVRVGRRALVGAGAVVTKDVDDGAVVVGNPARVVKNLDLDDRSPDRCPHC